ncbi:hypothetical protein GF339_07730 [candidate division KSB3 bacterium]|uniref:Tripartite tricarboxylate transporter substrate binding protein n=1 Tax=candidate division KSB3 bacterium TaxID=2044937 RepID=A0A9D5JVI3_9BACT|nr:hypothetical protein [candidate division KSB3 bacterium]MBD3324461.1 hypothetical protein [candidate division KSB3 bacterium]
MRHIPIHSYQNKIFINLLFGSYPGWTRREKAGYQPYAFYRRVEAMRKGILLCMLVLCVALMGSAEAWTPEEPIRLIVPWAPGGGTDTLARALAKHGEKYFGVPVVVENVEGAMGAIAAQRVKASEPDGYELMVISGFVNWIGLVQDYPVSFDDYTKVMNLNRDPAAFAVAVDSEIDNLQELQEYCQDYPGEFTVSHSGDGTTWHIAGVSLAQALGVEMNFVPFDGTAPGVAAVMGGKIDGVSGGAAEFVSQAQGGQLKVLAVLSEDRFGPLPDVPTMKEQGWDLDFYTTRGLVAAKGTPEERVQVLYEGFAKIAEEPEFIETMENIGLGIHILGPEEYATFLERVKQLAVDSLKNVGMLE